jgi:hypothetical protein
MLFQSSDTFHKEIGSELDFHILLLYYLCRCSGDINRLMMMMKLITSLLQEAAESIAFYRRVSVKSKEVEYELTKIRMPMDPGINTALVGTGDHIFKLCSIAIILSSHLVLPALVPTHLGVSAACLLPPFSPVTCHFIAHSHLSHIMLYTVNPSFFRSAFSSSSFHIDVYHSSSHIIFLPPITCPYQLKRFPFSFSVIGATFRLPHKRIK